MRINHKTLHMHSTLCNINSNMWAPLRIRDIISFCWRIGCVDCVICQLQCILSIYTKAKMKLTVFVYEHTLICLCTCSYTDIHVCILDVCMYVGIHAKFKFQKQTRWTRCKLNLYLGAETEIHFLLFTELASKCHVRFLGFGFWVFGSDCDTMHMRRTHICAIHMCHMYVCMHIYAWK